MPQLSPAVLLIAGALLIFSLVELAIPLRRRTEWSARHTPANLILTALAVAIYLAASAPMLVLLIFLQQRGFGLFNHYELHPALAVVGTILVMDLAWYGLHATMHRIPVLWRFHAVHHSDLAVDATTAVRQHPGETILRQFAYAAVAIAVGANPFGFAIYRAWAGLHGVFEHANIRLPARLDAAMTWVLTSPNLHKVHHSDAQHQTDSNYGNIFAIWDRLFGTFTPPSEGPHVTYGLEAFRAPRRQSIIALLTAPFRKQAIEQEKPASD